MSITGKYNGSAAIYGDIRDPRLSTLDVVNKSVLVGASLDDALASVSAGLIPFTFTSLAEQNLLSYNASTGRWVNRTVAQAVSGSGGGNFNISIGNNAAGTGSDAVAIGPEASV